MFPTQYDMKMRELTTLCLVNSAMFDVTTLRDIGRFMAYTTARVSPVIREARLSSFNLHIKIRPTTVIIVLLEYYWVEDLNRVCPHALTI